MDQPEDTLKKWHSDMKEYLNEFLLSRSNEHDMHAEMQDLLTTACRDIEPCIILDESCAKMDVDDDVLDNIWVDMDNAICESCWQVPDSVLQNLQDIDHMFNTQMLPDKQNDIPSDLFLESTVADLRLPIEELASSQWSLKERLRYLPMMKIPKSPQYNEKGTSTLEQMIDECDNHTKIKLSRSVYDKLCQFEKLMNSTYEDYGNKGLVSLNCLDTERLPFSVVPKKYATLATISEQPRSNEQEPDSCDEKMDIEAIELQLQESNANFEDPRPERSCMQRSSLSTFSGISSIGMNLEFSGLGNSSSLLSWQRDDTADEMEERMRRSNAPSPSSRRHESSLDTLICDMHEHTIEMMSQHPLCKRQKQRGIEQEQTSYSSIQTLPEQLIDSRALLQQIAINRQRWDAAKNPSPVPRCSSTSDNLSIRKNDSSSNRSNIQETCFKHTVHNRQQSPSPCLVRLSPLFPTGAIIKDSRNLQKNCLATITTAGQEQETRAAPVGSNTRFSASNRVDDFISLRRTAHMFQGPCQTTPLNTELQRTPLHLADKQQLE